MNMNKEFMSKRTFGLSPESVGKSKTVWFAGPRDSARINRRAPTREKLRRRNLKSKSI